MKKLKDSEISLIKDFTGIPVSIPLHALFTYLIEKMVKRKKSNKI